MDTLGSFCFTISWSLLKFISIDLVMLSHHLVLCHPLLLLPSIFPSIRVFSSESVLPIRWPKYWNFDICPSNEYSGLISFTIDWFDLLVVQGTLKSHLQHSSKASILWWSAFFMVQLSHPYWKNHSFDYMDPLPVKWFPCLLVHCLLLLLLLSRVSHVRLCATP